MHQANPPELSPTGVNRPSTASFLRSHFAPAFCFLPRDRRLALQVVYAFFRLLDDAVDSSSQNPAPLIEGWLETIRNKRPEAVERWGHAAFAAELLKTIAQFDVPVFALEDFLSRGVTLDLEMNRFETAMDTERYCYGVAGTVGLACLPIFGAPVAEAKDFAVRLGIAVQWVNLIRDVGADARLGRIYLPLDHLERFGCTENDVISERTTPEFAELIRFETNIARGHYQRALELMPVPWKKELRPARVMGKIYFDLLSKIEREGYPVFTKRVSLNIVEKALSTWRALKN